MHFVLKKKVKEENECEKIIVGEKENLLSLDWEMVSDGMVQRTKRGTWLEVSGGVIYSQIMLR